MKVAVSVLINNLPEQQLIYTKQSKLKVVKLIELNSNVKLPRLVKTLSAARFAVIPPTVTLMKISLHKCLFSRVFFIAGAKEASIQMDHGLNW